MIRVSLTHHLRTLSGAGPEVTLAVADPPTLEGVIDALEATYPPLVGTLRDPVTRRRRPMMRFYACEEDLTFSAPGTPLPPEVVAGTEPLLIVGAVAGG